MNHLLFISSCILPEKPEDVAKLSVILEQISITMYFFLMQMSSFSQCADMCDKMKLNIA